MSKLMNVFVSASRVVAFILFLVASVMTATGQLWVTELGGFSSVGLASICGLYVMSQYRFRKLGVGLGKSVVLAILFANAFLQSYEIVYGLSFSLHSICCDFPVITGTEVRTSILWIVMVSPLVLMREYLRFKWVSLLLIFSLTVVWVIWILYGFPQYYIEGYVFQPILKTANPFHLSLWFNFGSKAILAAFYASLLEPLEGLRELARRR